MEHVVTYAGRQDPTRTFEVYFDPTAQKRDYHVVEVLRDGRKVQLTKGYDGLLGCMFDAVVFINKLDKDNLRIKRRRINDFLFDERAA